MVKKLHIKESTMPYGFLMKTESMDIGEFTYNDDDMVDAVSYMYGVSYKKAYEMIKNELSEKEIKRSIIYWELDGLPNSIKQDEFKKRCKQFKLESLQDNFERYTYVRSKDVYDSDGFITDYTMYYDEVDDKYVFVFGDSDYYDPNEGYMNFDYECDTEKEANEWFDNYEGFVDDLDESCRKSNKRRKSKKLKESHDVMELPTSERAKLIIQCWDNLSGGLNTIKCKDYLTKQGWDVTNWDSDTFNNDWDVAVDLNGTIDDDEIEYEDGINTKEDAYRWLKDKIAEYGNTYHFPQSDKIKLDNLVDRFGSTYFWRG